MNTAASNPYHDAEVPECWPVETMPCIAQNGSTLITYHIAGTDGKTLCVTNATTPDWIQGRERKAHRRPPEAVERL